jgi:acyl-CoA thioester hydrolase
MNYTKNIELRWSDLDPNFHLRHSAYYDFGAYCRISFLSEHGVTAKVMHEHSIGPVLFREECFFKREIVFGDNVTINLKLKSISEDFRKFSMAHEIYRNKNELAALIVVDGAWMHTVLRKITVPPEIVKKTVDEIEKTDDFVIT